MSHQADPQPVGTPRRRFLALGGAALGGLVATRLIGEEQPAELVDAVAPNEFGATITVRRPADQCLLSVAFFNADIDYSTSPPVLARKFPGIGVLMSVEFGASSPMHVAERAYPLVGLNKNQTQTLPPTNTGDQPPIPPPPTADETLDGPGSVGARLAGASRLVFEVPDDLVAPGEHPLAIDTAQLLDFLQFMLSVVPNAVPPFTPLHAPGGIGAPQEPSGFETAIELPYNLIISPPAVPAPGILQPGVKTVFANATGPVQHGSWTELWHTRLAATALRGFGNVEAVVLDEDDRDLRTIRAVWCSDAAFPTDLRKNSSDDEIPDDHDPAFRSALNYVDRYDIVRLSSDFTSTADGGPYLRGGTTSNGHTGLFVPSPATVDRLMLTSLGGWLDCDAHWDLPHSTKSKSFNSSLLMWRHRAVQGRDSYVRVVRKGYLFPWGHRASLVTVTEREFATQGTHGVGAYLRQKTFIVLGDPVKDYSTSDSVQHGGRKIPFTSVECLTLITPDLDPPARYLSSSVQPNKETVFQPAINGTPFRFHFRGTDRAGDPIDLRTPVLWVDDTAAYGDGSNAAILSGNNGARSTWDGARPTISLHGQRVSLAEPKDPSAAVGDTQLVVDSFELGVEAPADGVSAQHLVDTTQPAFFPTLHSAQVRFPQAASASGNPVGATTLEYEKDRYLPNGFTGNNRKGGVFLARVTGTTRQGVTFNSDKSGAAVTPNLGIDGYSRALGPASGDLALLAAGAFDPKAVFSGVQAKLLGGLELSTILGLVNFSESSDDPDTSEAPALQLTSVERFDPHRIVTTLDWHPIVIDGGPTIPPPPASGGTQYVIFEVQEPDGQYPVDSSQNAAQVDGNSADMDLHAVIVTDLDDPSKSTSTVAGQIRSFNINLFGKPDTGTCFVVIPFDSLTFRAQAGKKTDVDVQVGAGGVQFQGPLSFVQELANYLNFDGSGLTIDTAGDAITATLTLAIPNIGVGVFALENLAFNAGVAIPYNGDPVRFDFAFCSRENPFQLEIMMFTGGGFVGLGLGADGVEMLEFSFDFGLGISIDIGVASGQVSLTGGVYYELEKQDDDTQSVDLSAWVKASGGVSALGVVSVSVELYLDLHYHSEGNTSYLAGDAEMTISVNVLCFGGSVSVSVSETFAGSDPPAPEQHVAASRRLSVAAAPDSVPGPVSVPPKDNTFGSSMSAQDWQAYCESFALIGVGV